MLKYLKIDHHMIAWPSSMAFTAINSEARGLELGLGPTLQIKVRIGELSSLPYVVGTQKNCLNKTVLFNTQNTLN